MTKVLVILSILFVFGSIAQNPVVNCPQIPAHTPKDINDLSPTNIDVIMALGDSITAGFGAMGREGLLDEFRGIPGAIGGDEDQLTISNFIKFYNPNIVGHSYGYHLLEIAGKESHYYNDVLNAAQSGATTYDFKDQVSYLISQLETPPFANLTSAYKLLNVLIGANDVCNFCKSIPKPTPQFGADIYESNIRDAIQTVYNNIPNTIVNLIPLFNLSGVYELTVNRTYCTDLHEILPNECRCIFQGSDLDRQYLDDVVVEFGKRLIKISNEWKSKNLTNFAVIYQPFTIGLSVFECGISFLSDLDCFHPSLLAHQKMTIAGWNSLIVPFAQKQWYFNPNEPFQCLDANSRIWTD